MRSRVTAILVIALLVSGGATYLVYRVLATRSQAAATPSTVVVSAAHEFQVGMVIKDGDVKLTPWAGTVPKGVALKKETVVGRGVIATIFEGEAVMENRLAAPGGGGGFAATIPDGMRAVAVKVNDIVGVAGFVVPGTRVDVLISGVPPGPQAPNGAKVRTLLQNIEVLSAGQNYQKDAEGKPVVVPVVNLLVNPEQAEVLSLASNETKIQLVLRNPLDSKTATPPGVALATLFGDPAPAPVARPVVAAPKRVAPVPVVKPEAPHAPPPATVYLIEVINGPKVSEAKLTPRVEEK